MCRFRIVVILIIVLNLYSVFPRPVHSEIVINEVYYDHPGYDRGWEYIELYNNGAVMVEVSGCRLELIDGRSGDFRTLWESNGPVALPAGQCLLIPGENYHPPEEMLLRGRVENGPDAVCLLVEGHVEDLVGYGDLDSPSHYEGRPAILTGEGFSLSRKPDGADTGINYADFVVEEPSPGRANFFDLDIGVYFKKSYLLPCRGRLWDIEVEFHNRGLKEFRKAVGVDLFIISEVESLRCGGRSISLNLKPGGVETANVSGSAVQVSNAEVEIRLRGEGDMNGWNDCARRRVYFSPGPLIVNEIMYNPGPYGSEWIELYNISSRSVDLSSWSISDSRMNRKSITSRRVILESGGFLVLARYPDQLEGRVAGAMLMGVEEGWPILNNQGGEGIPADAVMLYRDGVLAEMVWFSDLSEGRRGYSVERYRVDCCSTGGGEIWHRCSAAEGSTPGRSNSVYSEEAEYSGGLNLLPNPFCPDRDGSLLISGRMRDGENGFSVRIFDMSGFEVRNLFGESGGARCFSCRWDGKSSSGKDVPTGLYICVVEYMKSGGMVCRREKMCVAVQSPGSW